jgi:hypothetical protein
MALHIKQNNWQILQTEDFFLCKIDSPQPGNKQLRRQSSSLSFLSMIQEGSLENNIHPLRTNKTAQ